MSVNQVLSRAGIVPVGESIIQSNSWRQFDGLVHAFSTRHGGVGPDGSFSLGTPQGESWEFVEQNRRLYGERLGIEPTKLFMMNQVHGKCVVVAENATGLKGEMFEADGVITKKKNIALTIQTADCVPILLYDPRTRAIGAVHAGWRSASLGIITETISRMKTDLNSDPADCHALIGPSIGPCCYEVGRDVSRHFPASAKNQTPKKRYRLDLWKITLQQLVRSGIKEENILKTKLCTAHHTDIFFSYRSEGHQTGRMMALIMMR